MWNFIIWSFSTSKNFEIFCRNFCKKFGLKKHNFHGYHKCFGLYGFCMVLCIILILQGFFRIPSFMRTWNLAQKLLEVEIWDFENFFWKNSNFQKFFTSEVFQFQISKKIKVEKLHKMQFYIHLKSQQVIIRKKVMAFFLFVLDQNIEKNTVFEDFFDFFRFFSFFWGLTSNFKISSSNQNYARFFFQNV